MAVMFIVHFLHNIINTRIKVEKNVWVMKGSLGYIGILFAIRCLRRG